MPRKDLLNALIVLSDPSVQALRYQHHTPVPVGTSHQASIKSHANRAQVVSSVRTLLWTLSHVMRGSLASGMLPIAKHAQPGITVHTEIRNLLCVLKGNTLLLNNQNVKSAQMGLLA